MRLSPRKFAALIFTLTLALVPFAKSSAAAGGTISGTVTDPKGAVVVGATVTVTDAAGQQAHAPVQTDAQGRYKVEGLPAVEGRVTGAVFVGEGEFSLTPPVEYEKHSLSLFTGEPSITEQFTKLTLRFTDKTYEEIKASAQAVLVDVGSGCPGSASASHAALSEPTAAAVKYGLVKLQLRSRGWRTLSWRSIQ